MKYLLPLIFSSFLSVAQDSPKIDPNTGLPTAGVAKKEKFDKHILEALHGISTKNVDVMVQDDFGDLSAEVKEMLDNQKELFSRRNRFTHDKISRDTDLSVIISVGKVQSGAKKLLGFMYTVRIGRFVYLGEDKKRVGAIMKYRIGKGIAPNSDGLKTAIGNDLDRLALHIFEATTDQD